MHINPNLHIPFLLLVSAVILYLPATGGPHIPTKGDEADYIKTSKEMYASGDLLTPTMDGEPRFTKPPLMYWMIVSQFALFGESYFAARLPSVLFGALTIVFVYMTGLLLFDRRRALAAVAFCMTCAGMVQFSKIAMMDMTLSCTLIAAFYYFLHWYQKEQGWSLTASFLALAVSALVKSPVYPAFAFIVMILFLAAEGNLERFLGRQFLISAFAGMVVTLSWYTAMIAIHGEAFIEYYLAEHTTKFDPRDVDRLHVSKGLLIYFLPWSFYLLCGLYRVVRCKLYREQSFRFLLICLACFMILFLFPTYSPLFYAIPFLPYAALITGGTVLAHTFALRLADILTGCLLLVVGLIYVAVARLPDAPTLACSASTIILVCTGILLCGGRIRVLAAPLVAIPSVLFYIWVIPAMNFEIIPTDEARTVIGQRSVMTFLLRSQRFEDLLHREIQQISVFGKGPWQQEFKKVVDDGGYAIIQSKHYKTLNPLLTKSGMVCMKWKRWRRRLPVNQVVKALYTGKTDDLQEDLYLIGRKSDNCNNGGSVPDSEPFHSLQGPG